MNKLFPFSLLFILLACGGGGSTSAVDQPSQAGTQPTTITFKKVPESLSMFE